MTALIVRGNARQIPMPDESVDLIVTSCPYYGLRIYNDAGEPIPGQIGAEQTPQEYLESLWTVTSECWRVLKPTGSMFFNVGDTSIDDPLAAIATGRHHYLTVPPRSFVVQHFGGNARPVDCVKSPLEPVTPITTKDHHALVIPYRKGARPHRAADQPISTVATREAHALLRPAIDVDDCWYRPFRPREHLRAQRFFDSYIVTGNIGEQTMQAGNAVPCNVAQWVGERVMAVLS